MSDTQQDGFGKIVADMRRAFEANEGFPISAAYLANYADRVGKEAERMRKIADARMAELRKEVKRIRNSFDSCWSVGNCEGREPTEEVVRRYREDAPDAKDEAVLEDAKYGMENCGECTAKDCPIGELRKLDDSLWEEGNGEILDGILADCRELRQAARESRKEIVAQMTDPIAGLLLGFTTVFQCGIQVAAGMCILVAKRRMRGHGEHLDAFKRLQRHMNRVAEKWGGE